MVYQFRITEIVGDVCSSYHWDMIDHNAMCTKLYWIDVSDIDFTLAANTASRVHRRPYRITRTL